MGEGHAASAAALWAGLSLLILLGLSARVVRLRQKHGVATGDGGVEELGSAIRAHGNAAEYIPAGIAGLGILALAGAPLLIVHLAGAALVVGRVLHAVGLSLSLGASRLRAAGMVLTWIAFLFMAVALLVFSLI